jgi:hypothetical protein
MPGNIREGCLGDPEHSDTPHAVKPGFPNIRLKPALYFSMSFEFPRLGF